MIEGDQPVPQPPSDDDDADSADSIDSDDGQPSGDRLLENELPSSRDIGNTSLANLMPDEDNSEDIEMNRF